MVAAAALALPLPPFIGAGSAANAAAAFRKASAPGKHRGNRNDECGLSMGLGQRANLRPRLPVARRKARQSITEAAAPLGRAR